MYDIRPNIIRVDFEKAMHNSVKNLFPETQLDCCRFHLGQWWWRKIQSVGLSSEYKDKSSDIIHITCIYMYFNLLKRCINSNYGIQKNCAKGKRKFAQREFKILIFLRVNDIMTQYYTINDF
jgi:hypothetical protein